MAPTAPALSARSYRILYQGWSKVAALDEMQNGMFGYHAVWGNIPRFIRRVDVENCAAMSVCPD